METGEERTPLISGNLPLSTRLAYALGHIYNDLAAAMWFTYTLIYLQHVVLLQPIVAGSMLLLGIHSTCIINETCSPHSNFFRRRHCAYNIKRNSILVIDVFFVIELLLFHIRRTSH